MLRSLTALSACAAIFFAVPATAQAQSMQGMDHSAMPGLPYRKALRWIRMLRPQWIIARCRAWVLGEAARRRRITA